MTRLPESIHLRYNITRQLRTSYSVTGIIALACAMIGVAVATVMTKGLVPSSDLQYLLDPQSPGYDCNSTIIYPGQIFGSVLHNTSFSYQAVSQFAYKGQKLSSCTIATFTYIDVVGPPLNYPRIAVNQSASCSLADPAGEGQTTVSFSVIQVLYWGYTDGGAAAEIGSASIDLLGKLATYKLPWNVPCNDSQPFGFRIDQNLREIRVFPLNQAGTSICSYGLDAAPDAVTLMIAVQNAIVDDWTTKLTVLPDLLYPCVPRKKVWVPFSTLLLDVLTTMFAFFSPLFAVVLLVLQHLEDKAAPQHSEEEGTLENSPQIAARSSSRDKDSRLLSPSSPETFLIYTEESRLSMQRFENLVESLQKRIRRLEDRDGISDSLSPPHTASGNSS
ncbi:hypothetical protein DL93DRAFT_2172794 [Clavulina sp. PMI_390]|nr:hypothetical protein DL93DRAFT_2172794 [Clavulina sp. PMI_390]